MRKIVMSFALLATLLLVFLLPAVPAQAAAARTFVSAAGFDSNNCTNVTTPCRHLAAAFAATAPNGEIYVLDPANYGSLTIDGPVSIEGHGWASIAPVSGQAAITITANPGDKINIIGVVLDGTAIANTTGIAFSSGGFLNVRDSVIRNFAGSGLRGNGILVQPNGITQIVISNTAVLDNDNAGIYLTPTGSGTLTASIDQVTADHNNYGIYIDSSGAINPLKSTITDSHVDLNNNTGIVLYGTGALNSGTIRNTYVSHNNWTAQNSSGGGVIVTGDLALLFLSRSFVSDNDVNDVTLFSGAILFTDGQNAGGLNSNGGSVTARPPY